MAASWIEAEPELYEAEAWVRVDGPKNATHTVRIWREVSNAPSFWRILAQEIDTGDYELSEGPISREQPVISSELARSAAEQLGW